MHILRWVILALLAYGLFEAWRHRTAVLHSRVFPAFILWLLFQVYWSASSRNSAPTKSSESRGSTVFHQVVINVAYLLLFWPAPGLKGWFLPPGFPHLVAIGTMIEAAFILLAVWARRHLGRNWSAAVRIGEGHELVRTGPYRLLRHPIYTGILTAAFATLAVKGTGHAIIGVLMLIVGYWLKARLEESFLREQLGAEAYDAYSRKVPMLVPFLF